MRLSSLRTRLLALTLLTIAAGLGVLVSTGNVLLAHTVAADDTQRLSSRLDAQVAALSSQNGRLRVRDTLNDQVLDSYGWVYDGSRLIDGPAQRSPGLDALAQRLADAPGAPASASRDGILLGRRRLRVPGAQPPALATVIAGVSVVQLDHLRRQVLIGSIAVGLLLLLGAGLAVRRVLVAALGPVQAMTEAAEDWETHDLDRRFSLGPVRDEITALAATLDHLLGRIAASRRHEQRFAAEVAHELRTPLAAIRGSAELALDEDLDAGPDALSEIIEHSQRMATTLDTLIAFARREHQPERDGVDLITVLASFPVLELPADPPVLPAVEGETGLIRQLFAPLIDNAQRYANRRIRVEFAVHDDRVESTVIDDGPGVDPRLGEQVFLPGVRDPGADDDGAGLGLPLAQRLAHACGGDIRLGRGPGGRFVVSLPVARGVAQAAAPPASGAGQTGDLGE